jgi:hypothetical protein
MPNDQNRNTSKENEDVVGLSVHAASFTKFLWGVFATLFCAFVVGSVTFAWNVNSNCVEFRQQLAAIISTADHLANDVARLQNRLETAGDLAGIRNDVSQLQYSTTTATQSLNEITRQVRDLHPWPVQQWNQAPPAQTP